MNKIILSTLVIISLFSACTPKKSARAEKPAPPATQETADPSAEKTEKPQQNLDVKPATIPETANNETQQKTEQKTETPPAAATSVNPAAPVVAAPVLTQPAPVETPAVESPLLDIIPSAKKSKQVAAPAETPVTPVAKSAEAPAAAAGPASSAKVGDLLELSYEETRNFFQMITGTFGRDNAKLLMQLEVGAQFPDAEKLDIKVDGNYEKLDYQFVYQDNVVVEVKGLRLDLAKPTEVKLKPYTLQSLCVGAKCEILFLALYIPNAQKKLTESYPIMLKWDGTKYIRATYMEATQYKVQLSKEENLSDTEKDQLKTKLPPQLRVESMYLANFEAKWKDILAQIHGTMKSEDAIYSGRFFVNVAPKSFDEQFTRTKEGLQFELKIDFIASDKKAGLNFKALLDPKGVLIPDASGVTLNIVPIVKDQFFLLTFKNDHFKSYLKDSPKAIISKLCQILEEDGQVYTFCGDLFSSKFALGFLALEGRVGGPVVELVNESEVNNQKIEIPVITEKVETNFDFPKEE